MMVDPPVGLILSELEYFGALHMVMNSKHLLHYPKERENFYGGEIEDMGGHERWEREEAKLLTGIL